MKTEVFKNEFKTAFGMVDVQGINGYMKAMQHLYGYLAKVTAFNPDKRFVDAVPLLESIGEVNAEFMQILTDEQQSLTADMKNITLQTQQP